MLTGQVSFDRLSTRAGRQAIRSTNSQHHSHTPSHNNYLLTYDSYVPLYNRFHRGEWITRVSGGEWALDTPGPLKVLTDHSN
jgi:hypothetical protein